MYGDGNRLEVWPGYTFTNDLDGNRTRKQSVPGNPKSTDIEYRWSADGYLTDVVAAGVTTTYEHDAFGRLVARRKNGVLDRHFLWDGEKLLAELDGSAERRIAEYVYLNGPDSPAGYLMGDTAITMMRFLHVDERGNTFMVHDTTGAAEAWNYDTWGDSFITARVPHQGVNRLGWKSLMWEADSTKLYYVRHRWYDPSTGRFMSEDPRWLEGGVNQYLFSGNDPINYSDMSGLICATMDWDRHPVTGKLSNPRPGTVYMPGDTFRDYTGANWHCSCNNEWERQSWSPLQGSECGHGWVDWFPDPGQGYRDDECIAAMQSQMWNLSWDAANLALWAKGERLERSLQSATRVADGVRAWGGSRAMVQAEQLTVERIKYWHDLVKAAAPKITGADLSIDLAQEAVEKAMAAYRGDWVEATDGIPLARSLVGHKQLLKACNYQSPF